MKNGGTLVIEDKDEEKYGSRGEIKVGAKLKVLFNSLFVKGDAAIDSNIGVYTSGQNLIKTTITNTTLSDFLDILEGDNTDIVGLENFHIYIMENSIAYFQTITPYLGMTEGNLKVDENLAIRINKVYDSLKLGKGYYEVIGRKEGKECIFRFNNRSFKNNYGITDLLQMNLKYYGIEVGMGDKEKLDFTRVFEPVVHKTITSLEKEEENDSKQLPIYDIILAGVD
ncbi:hypothetical protein B5E53_17055 [Eubacterium sp. An11]|uniref:DUF6414 family protein n=1 Tax=Eubacterium sp. An11 TaxID=1965542 RepID=UPI000B38B264|nr:DUF6414 family protein [Eubacterium sp. An11]OUQ62839.1 hypothetical protein B5E53_17055 [Eubacterium sp. An11]